MARARQTASMAGRKHQAVDKAMRACAQQTLTSPAVIEYEKREMTGNLKRWRINPGTALDRLSCSTVVKEVMIIVPFEEPPATSY
ncbi:hypothetical protein B0T17DRAFT_212325 [Bombardia bombarda]|uniref:Uncharacterized protein n=1 Tax=Bombardia bombarda TaxID=252184 RepID=A0AA39XA53_9PEZI|nr:hypothetical protein B0T17DRAFT_212325 [Bombardia bombarda]